MVDVSYALTLAELGALVKIINIPKGAYLGCNDAKEGGLLTLFIRKDTDLLKLNLSKGACDQ